MFQTQSPCPTTRPASPGPAYQNWQMEHIQRDAQDRVAWERDQAYRRMEIARLRDRPNPGNLSLSHKNRVTISSSYRLWDTLRWFGDGE